MSPPQRGWVCQEVRQGRHPWHQNRLSVLLSNIKAREGRGMCGCAGRPSRPMQMPGPHPMLTAALVLCTWCLGRGLHHFGAGLISWYQKGPPRNPGGGTDGTHLKSHHSGSTLLRPLCPPPAVPSVLGWVLQPERPSGGGSSGQEPT